MFYGSNRFGLRFGAIFFYTLNYALDHSTFCIKSIVHHS